MLCRASGPDLAVCEPGEVPAVPRRVKGLHQFLLGSSGYSASPAINGVFVYLRTLPFWPLEYHSLAVERHNLNRGTLGASFFL